MVVHYLRVLCMLSTFCHRYSLATDNNPIMEELFLARPTFVTDSHNLRHHPVLRGTLGGNDSRELAWLFTNSPLWRHSLQQKYRHTQKISEIGTNTQCISHPLQDISMCCVACNSVPQE